MMQRLLRSPLLRNLAAVTSGTAAAQVIVLAFSPLITRIYTPEAFGIQGVFLGAVSICAPIVALRYPMAIVVAESEAEVRGLVRLCIGLAGIVSGLAALLLLGFREPFAILMGIEELGLLVWFLPVALFFTALQDVMDFRAARYGVFRLIGVVAVAQSFLTNLARVLGGLVTPAAIMLVAVSALAPFMQAVLLRVGIGKHLRTMPSPASPSGVNLLKAHSDFPLYRMPTDVLNAASQSVPVILLAALFSPAAAGLYTLTRSVLNLPSNLIGNAMGNVLYVRFAELAREGKALAPLLLKTTAALSALAPAIVGAAWFSPAIFAFVFGEEWREAGYYARWMSLWIAMMIINVPVTRSIPVIGRQNLLLGFNLLLLIVRSLSILGAYSLSGSALTAIVWFSVSSSIMIALSILAFTWCVVDFDRKRKEIANG